MFLIIVLPICAQYPDLVPCNCRAMKAKSMVFEIQVCTWVYSKEDTMAHTRRLVVIS